MSTMSFYDQPTWTKYVCSLGPASHSPEMIEALIREGATVLRSNFAHVTYEEYMERKQWVEEANQKLGTHALVQADLQGPNIRVGTWPDPGIELVAGHDYTFYTPACTDPQEGEYLINDATLHNDVKPGEPISFADGALEGEIVSVDGARIKVHMLNSGMLRARKSVNVPETILSTPAITEKDYKDLDFLLENGVDILALSFIGSRDEVDEIRKMVGDRPIKLISKIERRLALRNIFDIVDASDGIMIARGDLGIELPMEEVPIIQRKLIDLCAAAGKPVITATQMLYSMQHSHRPTRAEVSDVANAVFARSDALMLSEETNSGKYPLESLRTMVQIARRVEEYMRERPNYFEEPAGQMLD